jgi:hypothetical protein
LEGETMIEIVVWLLVLLEIQIGLAALLLLVFRRGDGFAHLELAGLVVTVYAGGRVRLNEHQDHGQCLGALRTQRA